MDQAMKGYLILHVNVAFIIVKDFKLSKSVYWLQYNEHDTWNYLIHSKQWVWTANRINIIKQNNYVNYFIILLL